MSGYRAFGRLSLLFALTSGLIGSSRAGNMAIERIDSRGFPIIRVQFVVPGTSMENPLHPAQLRIDEDGNEAGHISLALQQDPLAIEMVLDESGSMVNDIDQLKRGAKIFVDEMPENARVGIVGFASEVKNLASMTADRDQLHQAIDKLEPYGATALYDGIIQGMRQLDLVAKTRIPARKILVVFTDGLDQDEEGKRPQSQATARDVVIQARRRGVPLYLIGLGPQVHVDLMQKLAHMAGGRFFHAPRSEDLVRIYQDLARAVGVSYTAAFRSPQQQPDGARREIMVECVAPGLADRALGAYKAPLELHETVVAYHVAIEDALGQVVPQISIYQPYRLTTTGMSSNIQVVNLERELNERVGSLWSESSILSYQAARLALLTSEAALHRARILAQKSAVFADRALKEAELVLAGATRLPVETKITLMRAVREQVVDRTRTVDAYRNHVLDYHNAWAVAAGCPRAISLEAGAAASVTATGLSLESAELERAGLEIRIGGVPVGWEAGDAIASNRQGVAAGQAGLDAGQAGLDAGRAGLEAGRRSLEEARQVVGDAGPGVARAQEALDQVEEGLHGVGGAADQVEAAQHQVDRAAVTLDDTSDWLE